MRNPGGVGGVDERRRPIPQAWARKSIIALLSVTLAAGQAPVAAWADVLAATQADAAAAADGSAASSSAGADASSALDTLDVTSAAVTSAASAGSTASGGASTSEGAGAPSGTGAAAELSSGDGAGAATAGTTGAGTAGAVASATSTLVADGTEGSEAASAADAQTISVSVKVTGVAAHEEGEPAQADTWIPLTEVTLEADAGATAWDVFAHALDEAGYTYVVEGWYRPFSITNPDGLTLASTSTEPYSYWSFMLNGDYASEAANAHVMADGDTIELVFVDGSGVTTPEGSVTTNPDAEHEDLPSEWHGYADGGGGAVVEGVETPTGNAAESWKNSLLTDEERAAGASLAASDPLIIDGDIYVVASSAVYETEPPYNATKSLARLTVIDSATGAVKRSATLSGSLDSLCRPVYADGIIVVPLAGGVLQALSAQTLETLWVVDGIAGSQSLSTLTIEGGYVYFATVDALGSDYAATAGTVRRVNLYTGALAGLTHSDASGYYWAGGIATGGYYIVADDAGAVHVFTQDLAREVSSLALSAGVRSTIVAYEGDLIAVSKDGVLHKLALASDGTLTEAGSVAFAASSTSTPTVAGGLAYVGGSTSSYTGVLAVVDLADMTLVQTVTSYRDAAGTVQALPGDVKSVPLVSVQGSGTYAYFTCNNLPGGLYCHQLGEAAATMLHTPATSDQNYSMSSAFAGPDGTLYYINDSGNLFAITAGGTSEVPVTPDDPIQPSDPSAPSADTPTTLPEASCPSMGGAGAGGVTRPAGTVAATHAPLAQALAPSADAAETPAATGDEATVDEDEATSERTAESSVSASARLSSGASGSDDAATREANLPAIAGVAIGVAGVIAVGLVLSRKFFMGGER